MGKVHIKNMMTVLVTGINETGYGDDDMRVRLFIRALLDSYVLINVPGLTRFADVTEDDTNIWRYLFRGDVIFACDR